jgi:phosphoribosylglycinamide formyltransferase-1
LKRIAILFSGQGSHMRNLALACAQGRLPAQIAAVVCNNPDAPGLEHARELGLPLQVLAHRDFADRDRFDEALATHLLGVQPDLVVLAGFMRILTPAFVRRFAGRLVNIHPSLLPAFPGVNTHARALESGVRLHGATVHLVTEALDHGPILAQAALPVQPDDDAASLAARVLQAEHVVYPQAIRWLLEDRVQVHEGRAQIEGIEAAQRLILWGFEADSPSLAHSSSWSTDRAYRHSA